jgi:hypothetical protein
LNIRVAEQVDLAEKSFHDALARRNEAHIAYLLQPSIEARETFKAAKAAEAIALEILDTEVGWLASLRATTVIGLKLKASYASAKGKLTDSIVEDILNCKMGKTWFVPFEPQLKSRQKPELVSQKANV